MKIETIRIENFRAFKDETIQIDNYTTFVGPNGVGKSTVFHALNLFFRQSKDSQTDLIKLSASDFHHFNTKDDIKVTVTFHELSDKAKEDLSDYVRQNKLIVTAIAKYDPVTEKAEVRQFGNRIGMEEFRKFFEADKNGAKAPELKEIFKSFKDKYEALNPANSKADMIASMHEFEAKNPEMCVLIPSEDQFYGVSRGVNKLEQHIQWIFVPAIKDATEESEESNRSALGQLLARTVRSKVSFDDKIRELRINARAEYQKLLDAEQKTLDDISTALQKRLSNWAHPNITASVQWKQDPDKSIKIEEPLAGLKVGERGFEGELSRFGHGLQRSYMLALLQELSTFESENIPTLIMGIEEPELFQHPPQARYLAETLLDLAQSNSQIIICTHNPLFIPGDNFNKIRLVREVGNPSETKINQLAYDELAKKLNEVGEKLVSESGMVAKLYPSLNPVVNEMFFCKKLILVEGHEDIAHINSYLILTNRILDFRRNGCHIVPVEGKSKLIKPLAMAKMLGIPTMVIYDSDTNKENANEVNQHKKENKALLTISGYSEENEWLADHIIKKDLTAWQTNLTNEITNELGAELKQYEDKAAAFYGNAGNLKKNPLAIAKTLELAWESGIKSKLLIDLTERISTFLNE
ncbi:MAG: ATP-dependent endonuclease [Bacteroidetes bacterium GWF2_42_66]|nr:MAG: ATP-dependent endonuclease [Bacteroidetes bacterium GWA2_42_15]OFX97466.1 MAG: ATP-dependent endonuclease [Bacteroidetes bacterium GWE2_42_39]OFY43839.1 MAG: ATP-dependent endonuclease [Bacteroidetes bacterium GWF2_42_66]HBL76174.1 ATP-dependent endonuclease [Prolixibacteraceae bacterium]HCR91965.1 ATP-dependent endonuclease [Prolixibacteraceae bacterium]